MPIFKGFGFSGLVEKISPGGPYFRYARIVLFSLAGVFVALIIVITFPSVQKIFVKPTPTPKPRAECTKVGTPLSKGFQSWKFSYGDGVKGPKIQTASIDTLTPPAGSTQTLTLTIKNGSPVTYATATVYTDNNSKSYDLALNKGTSSDGTWMGIWKIDDTTNCIYHIDFDLRSSTGNWTGALTFR